MKKLGLICLICLLSACQTTTQMDAAKTNLYKTYYTDIFNQADFTQSSEYFEISASRQVVTTNTYRFDVIIDQAKVAMYDVEILVILDNGSLTISDTMMPSVGIFEDDTYNMIPYQSNNASNYVKGFGLNGLSSETITHLKVLVMWKDSTKVTQFKEYLEFILEN
jgi:hypothetical protein